MKKDDSSLSANEFFRVRQEAERAILRADAKGVYPTPVDEIIRAHNLQEEKTELHDSGILARLRKSATGALKRAAAKVVGLLHFPERLILVDRSLKLVRQTFLKLHEVGHAILPWQRDIYGVIEDSKEELDPNVADRFEREANVFASEVLFQLDDFIEQSCDSKFGVFIPVKLSKKFGASIYASIRQYVSKSPYCCAVLVLDPPTLCDGAGFVCKSRRVERSKSFAAEYHEITFPKMVTPDHPLGRLVPLHGKRASRPQTVGLTDDNGVLHEFVAEAFTQSYQVFILLHEVRSMNRPAIIMPRDSAFA